MYYCLLCFLVPQSLDKMKVGLDLSGVKLLGIKISAHVNVLVIVQHQSRHTLNEPWHVWPGPAVQIQHLQQHAYKILHKQAVKAACKACIWKHTIAGVAQRL